MTGNDPWEPTDRISGTLKGGPGYEAPWIVLRAGTIPEYRGLVSELSTDHGALEATAVVATQFQRVYLEAKDQITPAPASPPQSQQAAPKWASEPPGRTTDSAQTQAGPSRYCPACGSPMEHRADISKKTGKPYSGYFCTGSRDHKPVFE